MRTTAIKYKDRHQNEVIFLTSDSHFSTLFLQEKRLAESSEFRSNHNVSPYNKPFTFTGKEWCKSQWLAQRGPEGGISETGFSYFGARYYDSDLSGLFLSIDPMADKYPNLSPYAYCAWNPVKLVDPNGEFGVPTHKRMVKNALKNHTALSKSQQKQIVKATGWYSDLKNGDKPIHMDNHNPNSPFDKGVGNIEFVFSNAIDNYGTNIKNGNYREAGVNLHTIADFYSHSNYVEICQEYYGDAIKSVTDIPLYSEVYGNREKYAGLIEKLETELKTGAYNYDNVLEDLFTHDGNSHKYMNHDSPRSRMGKRRFNGIKGFDYAYSLAEREIIKTVSEKREE